ncbi:MAG: dihydrofolate reductase [Trueperaceae bacterium]|nr:dihydrofolate reductase [Trueperaceae bacterium]
MTAPVRIISAMTVDRVIGADDGMPWDVPEEYRHFVDSVRGGAVILGRTSYEIFGPDLEEVEAIVLTRRDRAPAGTHKADSVEGAVDIARELGRDPWIAGGASVYRQALPVADEMHLSFVPGRFEGDAYFPVWDADVWTLAEERPHPRYLFRRYVRARS